MAGKSGWGYRMPKCGRCGKMGAMFSPYSQQTVCPSCLAFERAAANLQAAVQAQAAADAAELEGVLQAEYRDAAETERDLRAGLHW